MLRRLIASRASAERTHYCVVGSRRSDMFTATFLANRSDERQQRGRIEAAGCWFESGRCVWALTIHQSVENLAFVNSQQDTYGHESAEFALEEVLQLTIVQLVFVTFFSRIGVKHLDEAPNSHFQGGGRVTRFLTSLLGWHFFCLTIKTCSDKSREYESWGNVVKLFCG